MHKKNVLCLFNLWYIGNNIFPFNLKLHVNCLLVAASVAVDVAEAERTGHCLPLKKVWCLSCSVLLLKFHDGQMLHKPTRGPANSGQANIRSWFNVQSPLFYKCHEMLSLCQKVLPRNEMCRL